MSHLYLAFKQGPLFQHMALDQLLPEVLNPVGLLHVELLYSVPCASPSAHSLQLCEHCRKSLSRPVQCRHWLSWWVSQSSKWEELVDDMSHRDSRSHNSWRYVGIPVKDKPRLLRFMRALVGCSFNLDSLSQLVFGVRLPFVSQRGATREFVRLPQPQDKFFCAEGLTLALFDQQYRREFDIDPCDMSPGQMYAMALNVPGAFELQSHPSFPHQNF
jgi:hypothetical protein